jgi:hypothetical protein
MKDTLFEVHTDIEKAIDLAFGGRFVLNFYEYLKTKSAKRYEVENFIESSTVNNINEIVMDLDEYLEGGSDETHKLLREAYGHIPKPQARKIRNYLYGILEDAWRYSHDKRPGRRKKQTK